jgi:hypothetical protein
MSAQTLRPDRTRQAGFWTGDHCVTCSASAICGAAGTVDACGDIGEYPRHVAHGTHFGPETVTELSFRAVNWPSVPAMAPAIPVLERTTPGAVVGIRWKTAIQPATWTGRTEGGDGYAVLIAPDEKLESLWSKSYEIARNLSERDVSLVIAPGFSTWWKHPPSESLLSMARSAEFARILARHLPTVPCVVWRFADPDLLRWADWLTATGCTALAVDLQTHREDSEWGWAIEGISYLAAILPTPLPRLVANGPSSVTRIRDTVAAWRGPVTILSQNPWQKAQQGWVLDSELNAYEAPEYSRDDLLQMNIGAFKQGVATALQARLPSVDAR